MTQIGEIHRLTTPDGNVLTFSPNSAVRLRLYGNYGSPPVNFLTRRGFKQHGVSLVDTFAEPRLVSIEIWHDPVCSRQEYWDMRGELLEFMRFNRGGQLTFTIQLPNGENRSLTVSADPGLIFPPLDNAEWQILERVDFIAFDPFWYGDTVTLDITSGSSSALELVFPAEFPIYFGGANDSVRTTGPVEYEGTWRTYPEITIYGPYDSVIIEDGFTGATITLGVAVATGSSRKLTLTPGAINVVTEAGNSAFSELDPISNLVNFYIAPDPLESGGVDEISAHFANGTANNRMIVEYRPRYYGI